MRNHRLYLDDILEAISKIERYVKGLTLEDLEEKQFSR